MLKHRILSLLLVVVIAFVGYFVYASQTGSHFSKYAFKLGLDLNGGTELTYRADVSKVKSGSVSDAMSSLRDVIERRVNIFGVSEPIVAVENPGIASLGSDYKLLVGLPGITDIQQAVQLIGKTPQLNFMLVRPEAKNFTAEELKTKTVDQVFVDTGLDGQYFDSATLQFTTGGAGQISGRKS